MKPITSISIRVPLRNLQPGQRFQLGGLTFKVDLHFKEKNTTAVCVLTPLKDSFINYVLPSDIKVFHKYEIKPLKEAYY